MTNTETETMDNAQISSLMDNEWDRSGSIDNLVRTLQSDSNARQRWARYHLARDVMQSDSTPSAAGILGTDFASKVASAIEAEPAIVAFPASHSEHEQNNRGQGDASGSVTSVTAARPAQGWRRNVIGLAVAASVALVSVVGLNIWRDSNSSSAPLVADNSASQVINGLAAGADQLELVANRGTYWKSSTAGTLSRQSEEKLNMFLSQHIESAPTSFTGMVPYSRLVGYDKVRRPQE